MAQREMKLRVGAKHGILKQLEQITRTSAAHPSPCVSESSRYEIAKVYAVKRGDKKVDNRAIVGNDRCVFVDLLNISAWRS